MEKSVKDCVLEELYLAENAVSGEALAKALCVSRNAVWKAVNALKAEGYAISAVQNRGYRLENAENVFSVYSVKRELDSPERFSLIFKDTVLSTNTELKQLAESGARELTVLAANMQTGGKGRRGRGFASPEGGLYMSILLRPDFVGEDALFLTAAAAVAVCDGIERVSPSARPSIKWVNDIYLNEKKVCGILAEAATSDVESGTLDYVVIGIGINLTAPKNEELRDIAGGIFDSADASSKRNVLAASVLNSFLKIYDNFSEKEFVAEYIKKSMLTGKTIDFLHEGRQKRGLVRGVDERIRLLVEVDGEILPLYTGEVTVSGGSWREKK